MPPKVLKVIAKAKGKVKGNAKGIDKANDKAIAKAKAKAKANDLDISTKGAKVHTPCSTMTKAANIAARAGKWSPWRA